MKNKTKFETIRPLIDEAFENGGSFAFKPNGISMKPFIKGGQTEVTIEKYTGGAKKYDIIFYTREEGQYVMHRIVKVYPDLYGVCGDNQWWIEKVREDRIFAIVAKVEGKNLPGGFMYLRTLCVRRFIIHAIKYIKKHLGGKRR